MRERRLAFSYWMIWNCTRQNYAKDQYLLIFNELFFFNEKNRRNRPLAGIPVGRTDRSFTIN